MLITPTQMKKWLGVRPKGVLHVGAHLAEESYLYRRADFGRVLWVEAQSSLVGQIRKKVRGTEDKVFHGAAWSESGSTLDLQITNNSQSTSLFSLAEHLNEYPDVVTVGTERVQTVRLDSLIPRREHFDFVTLDIQGAELEALKGLGDRLHEVKWVFTEVNRKGLYDGIPLVGVLDEFLASFGLHRVVTIWKKQGWGDALYMSRPPSAVRRFLQQIGAASIKGGALRVEVSDWVRRKKKRVVRYFFRTFDRFRGLG